MKCNHCKLKLKCVASCPVGHRFRYRVYKCPMCGKHWETLEIPATTCAYQAGMDKLVRQGRDYRNTFWKWRNEKH